MTNFKGTKGKWKQINIELFDWSTCTVGVEKGKTICSMHYEGVKIDDEIKANAKLIACAPEMLEMFESLINESDEIIHPEIKKDILNLIKKATE